jgi:L-ascorbate metabolism protein UlaG (beta-lactamase superfamily)
VRYTLLRNATAVLSYGGKTLLIDPALDPAEARPSIPNTPNARSNPLVGMPEGWEASIEGVDALIVTHLHMDHFDETAARVLDRSLPLFGQPEDAGKLTERGFTDLRPVDREATFGQVRFVRTPGEHGTGEIGRLMAPVSGFVLTAQGEPTLYIAGDTIWCDAVSSTIATYQPDVIIVNAGGARFLEGDPIVMTAEGVSRVHRAAPEATVIVVHLEAINHCLEKRAHYRERLPALGVDMDRIRIPENGDTVGIGQER